MRDLRALLNEQIGNLSTLEGIIRNQKECLEKRDVQGVIASIAEQGQCLERVHRMDKERKRLMTGIQRMLGLGSGEITLRELTDNLDPGVGAELRSTGEAIRATLENIGRVNRDNRRLIEHSLKVVQEMIGAISGAAPASHTYGESGTMHPHRQEHMLVDRNT